MKIPGWWMGWLLGLASIAGAGEWVEIPVHETREGPAGGFALGRFEVTVGEFMDFLNAAGGVDYPDTVQIRRNGGRYRAGRGMRRQAVAEVTAAEAEAYCRWRSQAENGTVRLPTEAEWEAAARGGVDGAPYPWGWGADPAGMAQFDAPGPAKRLGRYPANGFGLFDMAGNVFEWCAAGDEAAAGKRAARGGAWPERDPRLLRVDRRQLFPAEYRGRDVGFRVLREKEMRK